MRKTRLLAAHAAALLFLTIGAGAGVVPPGLTSIAAAQTTGSDRTESQEPPVAEPSAGRNAGPAGREPYARWKNHTGSAPEAAVCVTVQITHPETGKTEVRRGSGFVVRCDGFVMVPRTLVALAPGAGVKDQKNVLTFAAADGPIPPPQVAAYPRYVRKDCDFVLLKVNGHHFKGLSLLHPQNVREGAAVSLVYARPRQDNPAEVETVTLAATVGAAEPDSDHVSLTFPAAAPGVTAAAPLVPAGAVVVDAASGYALGIVAEAGAARFTTFAQFHNISNVVGLRPTPNAPLADAAAPDGAAPDASRDGMVWVPGGPMALTYDDYAEFAIVYSGRPVVCTPGFWIDRVEVTNGDYREFLIATNYKRLPNGWTKSELTQPTWDATYPVNGVDPQDAAAYALWRGKRLVTPTEWLWATQGAGGPWLERLFEARRVLDVLLARSGQEEEIERRLALEDLKRRGIPAGDNFSVETIAMKEILAERERVIQEFTLQFGDPTRLMPAGWREEDHSDFGVQDVAMNVPEILQPNYAQGPKASSHVGVGNKPFAALYDPIREYKFFRPYSRAASVSESRLSQVNGVPLRTSAAWKRFTIAGWRWEKPPIGLGFRCAR